MAVLRFARFTTDPDRADEMLAKRAALISTIKAQFPALTDTCLARVDQSTWIDTWRWESLAEAESAIGRAPSIPEAGAAFAVTSDMNAHFAEIVDER
jgi:hypothetical protein